MNLQAEFASLYVLKCEVKCTYQEVWGEYTSPVKSIQQKNKVYMDNMTACYFF